MRWTRYLTCMEKKNINLRPENLVGKDNAGNLRANDRVPITGTVDGTIVTWI
jgi:hypothetical protein